MHNIILAARYDNEAEKTTKAKTNESNQNFG